MIHIILVAVGVVLSMTLFFTPKKGDWKILFYAPTVAYIYLFLLVLMGWKQIQFEYFSDALTVGTLTLFILLIRGYFWKD